MPAKYFFALMRTPFSNISKWQWLPVELPVEPT